MKFFIIFQVITFKILNIQITITNDCQCNQIITEADCDRIDDCLWNNMDKICNKHEKQREISKPINNQTQVPETTQQKQIVLASSLYCSKFQDNKLCSKSYPCASFNQTCIHFTTCTAFTFITDQECQNISNRCISDGVQCIEKVNCEFYESKAICKMNKEGKFCFWNQPDINNQICQVSLILLF